MLYDPIQVWSGIDCMIRAFSQSFRSLATCHCQEESLKPLRTVQLPEATSR
jgi:hypothetical protein